MSPVDLLARRLLGMAVSRWPAGLRDDAAREWAAELDVLTRADRPMARRWVGALGYAGSLALARPPSAPGDLGLVRRPWWRPAWAVVSAPLSCAVLGFVAFLVVDAAFQVRIGGPVDFGNPRHGSYAKLGTTLGAVLGCALLGWSQGRRGVLPRDPRIAPWIPVLLVAGAAVIQASGLYSFGSPARHSVQIAAMVAWAVGLGATVAAAGALGRRPWAARAVAVVGVLTCAYVTVTLFGVGVTDVARADPLWVALTFPAQVLPTDVLAQPDSGAWYDRQSRLGFLAPLVLGVSAYAVAHALAVTRPERVARAAVAA